MPLSSAAVNVLWGAFNLTVGYFSGVYNVAVLPGPVWFEAPDLITAYIPMAWLGYMMDRAPVSIPGMFGVVSDSYGVGHPGMARIIKVTVGMRTLVGAMMLIALALALSSAALLPEHH